MNKGIRLIKRMVPLSLVLLLSIDSFAAVVSDNDGSAFITKAEFDSLKNNFQSQIDQYNTSIDTKIDGAIASYLAGIDVAKKSSVTLLHELNNVSFGKGFRSYNADTLSERVGDVAEWSISSLVIIPRAGLWRDLSQGLVSTGRSTKNLSSEPYTIGRDIYMYWSTAGGGWSMYNDLKSYMAWTIITSHSGVLKPLIGDIKPLIFCNEYGNIMSFDNSRVTMVDSRFYKGSDYPTSYYRGIVLCGTAAGSAPPFKICNINESLSFPGVGGSLNPDGVTTNFANSDGMTRALNKASTYSLNETMFCFNLNDSYLVDAFDYNKNKFYVNNKISNTALENKNGDITSAVVIRGEGLTQTQQAGGPNTQQLLLSRPEIHYNQTVNNTTLSDECFTTDSNDYYKRLKLRYLSNYKLTSSDGVHVPYIYQGLPLYKSDKSGKLEFSIRIKTNHNADAFYFVDPGDSDSLVHLRIKSQEFGWGDDTSNAVKMKIDDDPNEYEEIAFDPHNIHKIKIDYEEKKTYFIKWWVDGYTYGGEITDLGDAWFTEDV